MASYWFCVRHHTVEDPGGHLCPPIDRLGPYSTREEAERALEKAAERNEEWEAEDARWEGKKKGDGPGA